MANQEENQLHSHFFRAILSLENDRMKIPARFVKEHGKTLCKNAILQVGPGGLTWKLGVERGEEGRVWLLEGWKEFAEYYSIKFGHLLMFRYEGESKFDVSIFDPTLMEIQYPVKASSNSHIRVEFDPSKVVETEEEETDDGDDDYDDEEDDDDYDECPQRLHKSIGKSHANQSREGETKDDEEEKEEDDDYDECPQRLHKSRGKSRANQSREEETEDEDDEEEKEEDDDYDECPQRLHKSRGMSRANQSREEETEDDEEEKEEDDDYDECPQRLHKSRGKSRANQSSKKRPQRATSAWDKVLKRAEAYKSSHPCFSVRMLPKSLLCVPHIHSIRHFLGKENKGVYLKVGENGRDWFVKYCIGRHPFHQVRLLKFGWSVFAKDNHLEDGDVCIFELINSTKMVYKVAIFRIADYEEDEDDNDDNDDDGDGDGDGDDDVDDDDDDVDVDECPPVNQSKKRSQYSRSARNKVLQRARAFKCQNPSFIALMQRYHLNSLKSCLYVPVPHAKMYLLEKENNGLYLNNGKDQRTWYVSYTIEAPPLFRVRLSTSGWRPFLKGNHLEAGDVCVFELVDSSRMEYKVTIFRVADYA